MVHAVKNMVELAPGSVGRAGNTLVKSKYLKRIEALLKEDPDEAIKQFEEFRGSLCRLENMRVLVIADLETLEKPVSAWKAFVEGKTFVRGALLQSWSQELILIVAERQIDSFG